VYEVPGIVDTDADMTPNHASLRWFQTSPWDPNNLFVGTTDMNDQQGSRTARIYELVDPFSGL
jgi:hypothetical protein